MPKKSPFTNYKFRPSQLTALMTKPRSKSELLSETAKSILDEIYIKEIYGRQKIIVSKYLEKGTNQENESISMYRKHFQIFAEKNETTFENPFLKGTPDIVLTNKVVDVKTCWDIWTFHSVDAEKARRDYYYQLVAYMLLTGKKTAELAYCLVSNDEYTIYSELQKIKYMKGLDDNDPALDDYEAQLRSNHTYDDIPLESRIKVFSFELDKTERKNIAATLKACRAYLKQITL